MTPLAWALSYAVRSLVTIVLLHGRLVPDSAEYAAGRAWWSSPLTALAGHLAGMRGVETVAVAASGALGYLVAARAPRQRWSVALFLFPGSWFAGFPGADALGAATLVAVYRSSRQLGVAAAAHLVAGLVGLCVVLAARVSDRHLGAVAVLAGLGACVGQWHWQTRYLLPGAAIVAARGSL
jgi:hypothetical protein